MFYCPSGISEYDYSDDLNKLPVPADTEGGIAQTDIPSPVVAFGGFKSSGTKSDFILIAECSEVSGPNPIYTIPKEQRLVNDLNALCVRLLSADYQEFGCNKSVVDSHTHVLMPDIMPGVHVAISHFTLYDPEARGFVRPLSISYVTTDKWKLVRLAKSIFKCLSDASALIQFSNRQFCQEGFNHLLMDLDLTKTNLPSCDNLMADCDDPEQRLKVYSNLIESCVEDIKQILHLIQTAEVCEDMRKLTEHFHQCLSHKFVSGLSFAPVEDEKEDDYQPVLLKVPIQQNFDKHMRNLCTMSPGGILLALYHLNLVYKHFRRKYEDIFAYDDPKSDGSIGGGIYYGACVKMISCGNGSHCEKKCCTRMLTLLPTDLDFKSEHYLSHLHEDFFEILLDFLKSQSVEKGSDVCKAAVDEMKLENGINAVSVSGNTVQCCEEISEAYFSLDGLNCERHTVRLDKVWDVVENLCYQFPDADSVTLKVLQGLGCTESILLALLSRSLIVILYSVEEEPFIRIFIQLLAAITPQSKRSELNVVHHVGKHQKIDISNTAIVTYTMPCNVGEFIPPEKMSTTAVLDLTIAKFSGPKYVGCLLEDVNVRVKNISRREPVLPLLISVLSDVGMQVQFWKSVVASSASSSFSTMYLLKKGYTRYDIRIVEALSELCN